MEANTYWPVAPLTKADIHLTIKLHRGFGPDSRDYIDYLLRWFDPERGYVLVALYLLGRMIVTYPKEPPVPFRTILEYARSGSQGSYMYYLGRPMVVRFLKRARTYLEAHPEALAEH